MPPCRTVRIGVPRDTSPGERRVALTPDVVRRLVGAGHRVVVESGAGAAANFGDPVYTAAGADLGTAADAWRAEFIAAVRRPPDPAPVASGAMLLGLLQPLDDPAGIARLAATGVVAFAFELMPRTTRAQVVDALSSQATAAGYQAALEAAAASDRFFPMLTTAAGTLTPSKVLVLGAGVAGLQAIATARRLGAVVSGFDVRSAAAEQVKSLGAAFVDVGLEGQDAAAAGGYATEVAEEEQRRILEGLAKHVSAADAVICTAAIPGRPAPLLVDRAMVESMRPGSVIVDLAASTGGNCALTRPGETVEHNGVRIIGDTDLVSRVANHASQMYARNVAAFVELVVDGEGAPAPNWDDDIVAGSCVARDGSVVHPRVLQLLDSAKRP